MSLVESGSRNGDRSTVMEILATNNKVVFVESLVVFVLVWAAASNVLGLTDLVSSPTLVGHAVYELLVTGEFLDPLVATTRRVVYAFALTALVGTALGVLMGMSSFWEEALQDYIIIGMALPSLFAAVFSAMWFGFTDVTPTVASALIVFPYLTENVNAGINDIDHELIDMSKSFDASRARVIRRVILPSILPEWIAGARYSLAICWKIVALTELFFADTGIGYEITEAMSRLSLTDVIAWTVIFLVVMLLAEYGLFQQMEKRLFDWREDTTTGLR